MYLQLDTRFNPFTYEEMVRPLQYYKQAYDEAEAAYSDLVSQTEAWKDIANRENSPEAFEMYQRYSGDLARAADDFSRGMNTRNRRALLGLKRRYSQDIVPIARASEAMKEANDFRAKASPDAIFEVGEYNSIDQFLHGKTANNKFQSREALIKQTAAMTEAAMAEAMRDPEFQTVMGDQYWKIVQHSGGSYQDLTEAMKLGMMDNPLAQNRFSQIRQEMLRKAGVDRYDTAGQRAIAGAIDLGLYAGLDKPVIQYQGNQGYLNPLQAEQLRQMRMASSGGGGGRSGRGTSSNYAPSDEETPYDDSLGIPDTFVVSNRGVGSSLWTHNGREFDPSVERGRIVPRDRVPLEVTEYLGGANPNYYDFYTWTDSDTYADQRTGNKNNKRTHYRVVKRGTAPKEAKGQRETDKNRGV